MVHLLHTGRASSHLIRRDRQQRHPVLVRVYFFRRFCPERPVGLEIVPSVASEAPAAAAAAAGGGGGTEAGVFAAEEFAEAICP